MNRVLLAALIVAVAARTAAAHFVFVVPDADGRSAKVILSETLKPEPAVDVALASGAKLSARDGSGRETTLTLAKSGDAFTVSLGEGARIVHGMVDLGVQARGATPNLLMYHP